MEKSTISQAMLKVSELERIYRDKMYKMMDLENIIQEYILESDGSRHDCNEVVDFNREFELIIELGEEISQIKTKISKANNENYIETKTGRLSLQGALNKIKYLRGQVNNFEHILENVKSSKERKVDAAATSVYYKVKEPNFNKKDLKTTNFNITTSYKSYYDENNNYKSKFDGYKCEQDLKLEFDLDMEILSKVITAITKSKVEPRFNIRFSVKDKDEINKELLIKATENARSKAEVLTKAARVTLGRLVSIDYNWSEINIYSNTTYEIENKSYAIAETYAPSIEPEDIKISDTVAFVWEIK